MTLDTSAPQDEFILEDCDREPIHTPGSIQPQGVLLSLEDPGLTVLQASRNVGEMLGREIPEVLGRPVDGVLGPDLARSLRIAVANPSLDHAPLFVGKGPIATAVGRGPFDAIVHRHSGALILELEPSSTDDLATFRDLYPMVRTFLTTLDEAPGVVEVCRLAAAEARRLTGFDRALIYQFDEDWNGTVVAEDRNEQLPSYLDLRFPASDIPPQARALYRDSRVRLIADARYQPVPIVPFDDPRTGRPLDLSFATLRSVSPVHVEYMANMGTAASMSISILRDGELWGLISCHHKTPRFVPYEARTAADFLGQALSVQVAAKQRRREYEDRIDRKVVQVRLLAGMTAVPDFVAGLTKHSADLLDLVGAQGAAIFHEGQCTLLGVTPEEKEIDRIVDWLEREGRNDLLATDTLGRDLPLDDSTRDVASGLLAIAISKIHRGSILWFRPELVRTVTWGGDPTKPIGGPGRERLHPRTSFESWREIVRSRSVPWGASEVEAASELRNAIVGIVFRQAEERAQLIAELERSNHELEAFSYSVSHDLRAPFRHIVGYAELLGELEGERIGDEGRRYLSTIVESAQYAGTLVDNLLAFARMGRTTIHPVPIDMNSMTREVVRVAMSEAGDRPIAWDIGELPPVEGDLMMLRLAMTNLVSNAVKYTRTRAEAVIEIRAETRGGEVVYSVKDNGIGFDMKYADKLFGVFQRLHRMEDFEGTGIGLANIRRIVARHGGRAWGEGEVDRGATFFIALPRLGEDRGPERKLR